MPDLSPALKGGGISKAATGNTIKWLKNRKYGSSKGAGNNG
jgi:hypothetical protein